MPYEIKRESQVEEDKAEDTTETVTEEKQTETTELNGLHFEIKEDTDTRDNSKIFVVKVVEKLDREQYIIVNNNIKAIGGYYSKFKHGFIFKEDPTELLNSSKQEQTETESEIMNKTEQHLKTESQPKADQKPPIDFEIEQSEHTQTKQTIWLVKPKTNLSKLDFAEVKQKFATLKGFYSSFNNSFIFKYDPTEKIKETA
jgi:hypothetical protein